MFSVETGHNNSKLSCTITIHVKTDIIIWCNLVETFLKHVNDCNVETTECPGAAMNATLNWSPTVNLGPLGIIIVKMRFWKTKRNNFNTS